MKKLTFLLSILTVLFFYQNSKAQNRVLEIHFPAQTYGPMEIDWWAISTDSLGSSIVYKCEAERFESVSSDGYSRPFRSNASQHMSYHGGCIDSPGYHGKENSAVYNLPNIDIPAGSYYFHARYSKDSPIGPKKMGIFLIVDGERSELTSFNCPPLTYNWNRFKMMDPIEIRLPEIKSKKPEIKVDPETVDFGEIEQAVDTLYQTITIVNSGTAQLDCSVSCSNICFNAFPVEWNINPGENKEVKVGFISTNKRLGKYSDKIVITSNAPNSIIEIPVSATIVAPPCSLSVSPTMLEGIIPRDSFYVKIESSSSYQITLPDNGPMDIEVKELNDEELLIIAEHFKAEIITDSILVQNECGIKNITISLPEFCLLETSSENAQINSAEQNLSIVVKSNASYNISLPEWIQRLETISINDLIDSLVLRTEENPDSVKRTGIVEISSSCSTKTAKIAIEQEGRTFSPPQLRCNVVNELNFGTYLLDTNENKTETIILTNDGELPLLVTASISGDRAYEFNLSKTTIEIPGQSRKELNIDFKPKFSGLNSSFDCNLKFQTNTELEKIIQLKAQADYSNEYIQKVLVDSLFFNYLSILRTDFRDEQTGWYFDAIEYPAVKNRPFAISALTSGLLAEILFDKFYGDTSTEIRLLQSIQSLNQNWNRNKSGLPTRYVTEVGTPTWVHDDYSLTDLGILLGVLNGIYNQYNDEELRNEIITFYNSLNFSTGLLAGNNAVWQGQRSSGEGFAASTTLNENLVLLSILRNLYPEKYMSVYDYWVDVKNIPKTTVEGYELQTDVQNKSQAAFVQQFCDFFVAEYKKYKPYLSNQYEVERLTHGQYPFQFSKSAGSCESGYCVSTVGEDNSYFYPASQAYYLSIEPEVVSRNLLDLWRTDAPYELNGKKHLWVYTDEGNYRAKELIAIDLLPALAGLAFYQDSNWVNSLEFNRIDLFDTPNKPASIKSSTTMPCYDEVFTISVPIDTTTIELNYIWNLSGLKFINNDTTGNSVEVKPIADNIATVQVCSVNGLGKKSALIEQTFAIGNVPEAPVINGNQTGYIGESLQFAVSSPAENLKYKWSFSGEGEISGKDAIIELMPQSNGILSLTAENSCGSNSSSINISVVPKNEIHIRIDTMTVNEDKEIHLPVFISPAEFTGFQFSMLYGKKLNLQRIEWSAKINSNQVLINKSDTGFVCVFLGQKIKFQESDSLFFELIFNTSDNYTGKVPISVSDKPTPLEFSNQGIVLEVSTSDGFVHINQATLFDLKTTLKYHSCLTPITNTTLELLDSNNHFIERQTTNEKGEITFTSLKKGSYRLVPRVMLPWGGVNARDMLIILKEIVGLNTKPMDKLTKRAADVSGDNSISIFDLSLIAKRVLGESSFPIPDFVHTDLRVDLDGKQNLKNIKTLAAADVNGDYFSTTTKSASDTFLPGDSTLILENEEVVIPFQMNKTISPAAGTLNFYFQNDMLQFSGISLNGLDSSEVYYNVNNDTIKVLFATLSPIAVAKDSTFVSLNFKITDRQRLVEKNLKFDGEFEFANFDDEIIEDVSLTYPLIAAAPTITSLEIREKSNFHLYPNPVSTNGIINIETGDKSEILKIELFSVNGKKIQVKQSTTFGIIHLVAPEPGIYLLRIKNESQVETHKVIVR